MLKRIRIVSVVIVLLLSGCASDQYSVTYVSDPEGAQLYCNGVAQGYTPVTLYYRLDKEIKKRGVLNTPPCGIKWVSGATANVHDQFNLSQFPDGVMTTSPRPNVPGYSQDVEFALKVRTLKAYRKSANAAQQNSNNTSYENNNTVQCKKMGALLYAEVKTFSGVVCPVGWFKAY